jgi:hypothetical protein
MIIDEAFFLPLSDIRVKSAPQTNSLFALSLARERPHMILGVFVRDVDSGNAEREPIDDPTGWRVIDAAGTRPSENPLIPIEGDNNTAAANNTSTDRTTTTTSMNFMSNAHLESLEEGEEGNDPLSEQTPRPNRYMFQREERTFLLVDEKSSTEPESLTMDSGGSSKVRKISSTILTNGETSSSTTTTITNQICNGTSQTRPTPPYHNQFVIKLPSFPLFTIIPLSNKPTTTRFCINV